MVHDVTGLQGRDETLMRTAGHICGLMVIRTASGHLGEYTLGIGGSGLMFRHAGLRKHHLIKVISLSI